MSEQIVDYVEIIMDPNGQHRVRGRSNNGTIIWTTEQYGDLDWAQKIADDSGKEVRGLTSETTEEGETESLEENTEPTESSPETQS